jgi:hypothetical protein
MCDDQLHVSVDFTHMAYWLYGLSHPSSFSLLQTPSGTAPKLMTVSVL